MTKIGQLRIWHFANLGSKHRFRQEVKTIKEAKEKLNLIADYDLSLGDTITSNAQGLEVYVGLDVDYETMEGWEEWMDDEGNDICKMEE